MSRHFSLLGHFYGESPIGDFHLNESEALLSFKREERFCIARCDPLPFQPVLSCNTECLTTGPSPRRTVNLPQALRTPPSYSGLLAELTSLTATEQATLLEKPSVLSFEWSTSPLLIGNTHN